MRPLFALLTLLLTSCASIPSGVTPVSDFNLERYLGTWHEIARLDHSFERGLTGVTATYSLRDDGGVRVLNRGFDPEKGQWRQAEGKAYFLGDPATASLKVSFFGPFYGGYHILDLDPDYQVALVAGNDRDYLWILARQPEIDAATRDALLKKAKDLGFATEALIWVEPGPAQ
ncbi:MAG: lipocalin [Alphaproteobacteria bacterium CG_4_10_14_0_2_um_filter_63_37]|nr:MAG: lipocalin [Proteobacteria bacterium CG1_02_64_396]PJA26023.1 MAG: lipocalin [Alphaproteobacteria bacterium CG_4_10_14_0_2_um_filter_63_37]